MNSRNYHLDLFGLLALVVFTIFTFISVALYPQPYSPLFDWLSNLGNAYLNHWGAVFFNWGCIITGIILIPFIMNFYRWDTGKISEKILLGATIVLGVFASISLIGVGIFPETHIHIHVLAATGVFELLFLIVILMSAAIFNHPKFMISVGFIGAVAVIIDLLFITFLSLPSYHDALASIHSTIPIPGLEWSAVFSSLIWLAALSFNMYKNNV